MSLLPDARSDPSKIAIVVPWFTLFRLKGLIATEQPNGAGPTLSKREGQMASGGTFQHKFPCGSEKPPKAISWK